MNRILLALSLILISSLSVNANELETLKENYKKALLFEGEEKLIENLLAYPQEEFVSDQMVIELMDRYPTSNDEVRSLIENLTDNGSWSDIDYTSNVRSGWKPKIHAERILRLARVYNTCRHDFFQLEEVEEAFHLALAYWYEAKHVCPNWWYNQIGVPKSLGGAFILMEDKLTEDEKLKGIEILEKSKFGMTGQNKVWLAGNVLVRAMLENDYDLAKEAQGQIFAEIKIGEGKNEGIKTDWCFHQHGAQQQFGNYGAAFLATTSFWAKVFSGTSLALDQPRLDLLSDLILNGYNRILWRGVMDVNGLGRQFYKQVQTHKAYSACFSANILAGIDSKNEARYNEFIKANVLSPELDVKNTGLYHFWLSEQTVNRTPKWMTSIKMSSKRVIGAESGNGDNMKGYYLAHGAMYTYINGTEYYDISPVWDWRKIPGTTTHEVDKPLKELGWLEGSNNSEFVGNVNDGAYGMTVLDLNKDGLKAKKAWILTPNYTFCLGAAIESDSLCGVTTTIEQRFKEDELYYMTRNRWMPIDGKAEVNTDIQRYHHSNVGYIVMGEAKTTVLSEERTGAWSEIMNTYPNVESENDTRDVVSIYLNHGTQPTNGSYQYLVLPLATQEEVERFNVKNIQVLRNDSVQQIVNLPKENKVFIVSRTPVETTIDGTVFKTTTAGLFMLSFQNGKWLVTASDPTHRLEKVTITVGNELYKIDFPQGEYKGKSIAVK